MADHHFDADWYADPTGRHPQRYYDGAAWTDRVRAADGYPESYDPPQVAAPTGGVADAWTDGDDLTVRTAAAPGRVGTDPVVLGGSAEPAGEDRGGQAPDFASLVAGLGSAAAARPEATFDGALAGIGGFIAASGLASLIGQSMTRGPILAAGVLCLTVAYGIGLKLSHTRPWIGPAAVGFATTGFFLLPAAAFIEGGGVDVTGRVALIAGLLHVLAWFLPGLRGRPFLLGAGLMAIAFGVAVMASGGGCDAAFGQCNVFEGFTSGLGLSTGSGMALLACGAIYLVGVYRLDAAGHHGIATPVAAACLITMIAGGLVLAFDLGDAESSVAIALVGLAVGLVGHRAARRAMTWAGAGLVGLGVASVVSNSVSSSDETVIAFVLIVLGSALVAVPAVLRRSQSKALST